MAAEKRFPDEIDGGSDPSREKRIKRRLPSIATIARDAMSARAVQNMLLIIEPTLRRAIHEELQMSLLQRTRSSIQRSPRIQIEPLEETPLQLKFSKRLSLPIFTGTKIEGEDSHPLQIIIINTSGGREFPATHLPTSIKLELLVVDGNFAGADEECGSWTVEEFETKIVKEREGKRPLLIGEDVSVIFRDGMATVGDIMFTDNSSWTRSRHFRLAVRVAGGNCQGLRIREAISQRFMVKDHRVEMNRKHYPPSLDDDVWRLKKIGRGGSFHMKLVSAGIRTVQDLLRLNSAHPQRLRKILGTGMSDKTLDSVINHAKTCFWNPKFYVQRKPESVVVFNPICEPVGIDLHGIRFSPHSLVGTQKAYVERLVTEAYYRWDELEEVNENPQLGESSYVIPSDQQDIAVIQNNQEFGFINTVESLPENELSGFSDSWLQPSPADMTVGIENDVYNVSYFPPINDIGSISSPAFFNQYLS